MDRQMLIRGGRTASPRFASNFCVWKGLVLSLCGCISPGISVSLVGWPGFGFCFFFFFFTALALHCASQADPQSDQGSNPMYPTLEGRFFTTGPPGKSLSSAFDSGFRLWLFTAVCFPALASIWVCASPFQSVFIFYQYLRGS